MMNTPRTIEAVIDVDTNIVDKSESTDIKDTLIEIQRSSPDNIYGDFTSPTSSIAETVQRARDAFGRGITKPVSWRKKQLKALQRMCEENRQAMLDALYKDLRKPLMEAGTLEVDFTINDLIHIIYSLDDWAKPEKPSRNVIHILDDLTVYHQPYGVVLVIGTWNYPFQLSLLPMAGAISAGNAVVFKPSDLSETCAQLMADLIPKYLDKDAFVIVQGGVEETTELLKLQFDYIFFTGSCPVGRIIYDAASKFLTPVTLELGGKSPVYVDASAKMVMSVKRILWGKVTNAGQTCIAPDYVICTKVVQQKFLDIAKVTLHEWYGNDVQKSPHYARIINNRHFNRLQAMIDECHHKIAIGGRSDASEKFIEPTIMSNVTGTDAIMRDEIFGPILPITVVGDVGEAIAFMNARDKPLILHIFAEDNKVINRVIDETSSGGITVNECLFSMSADTLPFGGVGASGIGAYHGKTSFETFSHSRGCFKRGCNFLTETVNSWRYPPLRDSVHHLIRVLSRRRHFPFDLSSKYFVFFLGFTSAILAMFIWCKMAGESED